MPASALLRAPVATMPKQGATVQSPNSQRQQSTPNANQNTPASSIDTDWSLIVTDDDEKALSSLDDAPTSPANTCDKWIIDSGASRHYCNNERVFTSMKPHNGTVRLANGSAIPTTGIGPVGQLQDVKLAPDMTANLLSIVGHRFLLPSKPFLCVQSMPPFTI